MPTPILTLSPRWTVTEKSKVALKNLVLGDGYNLLSVTGDYGDTTWEIESPVYPHDEMQAYKTLFEQLAGVLEFRWSATGTTDYYFPLRTYTCEQWRIVPVGPGYWRLTATFEHLQ